MPPLVLLAIPLFLASMLVEARWARRRGLRGYDAADTRTSVSMGLGSLALGTLYRALFLPVMLLAYEHRWLSLGTGPWVWLLALLGHDFLYYWAHRFDHARRVMWAAHVTHHSSEHLNLSTAVRQSWTQPLVNRWFYVPLAWLGFDPRIVATVDGVSALYQFFLHTELVRRLGVLEWVLNTPSHHRVHHASNAPYLDRNHGGMLIIWDRLFGTFAAESEQNPPIYGLVEPMRSHNPFVVAFHAWWELARDVWRAPGIARKLRTLVSAPGEGSNPRRAIVLRLAR